ncbi:unknown [Clostridium sp. CAG:288]|nr:unknown [Clostridium sp. CAG:288]
MKVKYETIFERLSINGNMISFKYKNCINEFLQQLPSFNNFVERKHKFLNLIENQYKDKYNSIYKEGFSLYINSLFNEDFVCSNQYIKFKKEELEIKNMYSKLIISNYAKIESELNDYILSSFNKLELLTDNLDCKNCLIKTELSQILDLFDDDVYLKVYFRISDILKENLIKKVKYDNYESCYGFINPEIYFQEEIIFYAVTDDDIYYWL